MSEITARVEGRHLDQAALEEGVMPGLTLDERRELVEYLDGYLETSSRLAGLALEAIYDAGFVIARPKETS